MKKPLIFLALFLLVSSPAMAAYTAYPDLTSSTTNGGLTTGSLIGYTVYALDGATVIQTRTTTGIVESPAGSGYYTIAAGLSVPAGTTYIVRWDRSDTSTFLGAAKTQVNSLSTDTLAQATTNGTSLTAVQSKTALIATNAMDSPNEVASQGNAGSLLLSLATYQSALMTGSTTTVLNTPLTGTADLTGNKVVFTTGVNKGVTRTITAMNTSTGAITLLTALATVPGSTDSFSVLQGSKALEQFLFALGSDNKVILSANAQTGVTIPAVTNVGTTGTLTGYVAAPTTSQIAAAVPTLAQITALFPAEYLTSAEQTYLAKLDATVSSRMATFAYTAPPAALTDYQQRAVAVTLPTTAPTGYGGGSAGDTSGVTTLLSRIPGTVQPQTGDSFAALAALPSTSFITIPAASTISGTALVLTQKQVTALNDAVSGGDNVTSGPPVASASVTVTYYLRGSAHTSANIVEIATVNYDANKAQTSRTVKVASPFPTF